MRLKRSDYLLEDSQPCLLKGVRILIPLIQLLKQKECQCLKRIYN